MERLITTLHTFRFLIFNLVRPFSLYLKVYVWEHKVKYILFHTLITIYDIQTQNLMTNNTNCYLENVGPRYHNNYLIIFCSHRERNTKQILDVENELFLFKTYPFINS